MQRAQQQDGEFNLQAFQGMEGAVSSPEQVSLGINGCSAVSPCGQHASQVVLGGAGLLWAVLRGDPANSPSPSPAAAFCLKHEGCKVHCQARCQACALQARDLEPAQQEHCFADSQACDTLATRMCPCDGTAAHRPVGSAEKLELTSNHHPASPQLDSSSGAPCLSNHACKTLQVTQCQAC